MNPWWATGIMPAELSKQFRRFVYYDSIKWLESEGLRRFVLLTGLRRVGKTTILYQMMDALLKRGVAPQKIVFISMDHPMLKLSGINEILECYHENMYAEQDAYYFFDEIQYAADWDLWFKVIYDRQPNTRAVATGSASPALLKGSRESGVGRWTDIAVPTLSFYEYCQLIEAGQDIALPEDFHPMDFVKLARHEQHSIIHRVSAVQNYFTRYLQFGGFPELAIDQPDPMVAHQIIRDDVVDRVLKRDLPALYNIRNTTELEKIFLYLCNVSSSIVSIEAIAKELTEVSRPTVENYIRYLESASLIYVSQPVGMAGRKVLKSRPKIYVADAAIRNAVLLDSALLTNAEAMGVVVETAVYKHVLMYYYKRVTHVGYFRGGSKNKEIDIVVDFPDSQKSLIEVKYREQAPIANDDAICDLASEAKAAFIITKRGDDYGVHNAPNGQLLARIPAYAFLYMLGHAEQNERK